RASSHVRYNAASARWQLTASDFVRATTCVVGAQVEEDGAVTVPARLLTDFGTSLPNDRIELNVPARGRQLHIQCARNEATMAGMDAADFPPVPAVADGLSLTLEPKTLRKAISQVQFAAAADDTRHVLTGVHTLAEGRELTVAAADGFRLAVHTLQLTQDG